MSEIRDRSAIDLNERQVAGLLRSLKHLDHSAPVRLTLAHPRLIVECENTNQRWEIGPRW